MNEEKHGQHLPWNEGLPTRPDVDALMKAFPIESLAPGTRITDAEVHAVVGISSAGRYRTVYEAWARRLLRDHNVILERQKMTGFFIPTAAQVQSQTHPAIAHAGRTYGKQIRKLAATKPAEGIEFETREHMGRLLSNLKRETKKARMNILPSTKATEPPQIAPPKKATS